MTGLEPAFSALTRQCIGRYATSLKKNRKSFCCVNQLSDLPSDAFVQFGYFPVILLQTGEGRIRTSNFVCMQQQLVAILIFLYQ